MRALGSPKRYTALFRIALIGGIENGLTYFNIHTTQNPGGELRTQLLPSGSLSPAPSQVHHCRA
jgi:hypothetical protein